MSLLQRLALGLLVVLVLGFSLNYDFFLKHLEYIFDVQPTALAVKVEPLVEVKAEPNHLEIADLNISAPLIYAEGKLEQDFQAALQNGVVHYPGTAKPGQFGNAYYFGHSSDYPWSKGNYKTVFALLTKIKIGTRIVITDEAGHPLTYLVTGTQIVAPSDLSVLDQHENKQQLLTLQTSYPIGTALKRFIVTAKLQD